jgi:hypothetical protein
MARRKKRRLGLFDLIMVLIVVAVVWLFLGQAGIVAPLPIGGP